MRRIKFVARKHILLFISICLLLFLLCSILLLLLTDQGPTNGYSLDQFEWPPYVDVRSEVDKQLLGEPPSSYVINHWADFRTVIEPNCADWHWNDANATSSLDKEILVLVKSSPDRTWQRAAIRASFGAFNGVNGYRVRTLFIMGSMLRWRTYWRMPALEAEARQWGDMLVADHEDDYFRSTFKLANSIKLARHFCGRPHAVAFALLLDDDFVLFPWELVKLVQTHSPVNHVYEGYCYFNSAVPRGVKRKMAVTLREYPFSEFPPYCTGGTVLLSRRTIEEFYLAIQHVEFFVWEDIYTGILAHLLAIRPVHNPQFWAYSPWAEPYFMNCYSSFWRNAPRCNDWHGVVSAHGYSPAEIQRIYTLVHGRWMAQQR